MHGAFAGKPTPCLVLNKRYAVMALVVKKAKHELQQAPEAAATVAQAGHVRQRVHVRRPIVGGDLTRLVLQAIQASAHVHQDENI